MLLRHLSSDTILIFDSIFIESHCCQLRFYDKQVREDIKRNISITEKIQ